MRQVEFLGPNGKREVFHEFEITNLGVIIMRNADWETLIPWGRVLTVREKAGSIPR